MSSVLHQNCYVISELHRSVKEGLSIIFTLKRVRLVFTFFLTVRQGESDEKEEVMDFKLAIFSIFAMVLQIIP